MNSYEALATRADNATNKLIQTLRSAGAGDHAEDVAQFYISEKIAVLDVAVSTYKIAHGAFLDPEIISRAVERVNPKKNIK